MVFSLLFEALSSYTQRELQYIVNVISDVRKFKAEIGLQIYETPKFDEEAL